MRNTNLIRCRTLLLDQLLELERNSVATVQGMSTVEDVVL